MKKIAGTSAATELFSLIAGLGAKYSVDKIILFGSRARGDNAERSDIDIAVYGLPLVRQCLFSEDIDNLPTLLEFDVVYIGKNTSPELLKEIEKNAEHDEDKREFLRDSIIQRFEFTTELAWKTIREYELLEGIRLDTPREVLKRAFKIGVITDEAGWLLLLQDRNNTSHVYDENIAIEICSRVEGTYLPLFDELAQRLESYAK